VTYAVVARAPIEEIEAVRKRMGWRFPWVSSYHSDFNYDFNVSFTPEQSRPAARSTISNRRCNGQPESKISPAIAFSTRTRQVRSSTPIRPMGAAVNSFSASTDILTLCRRGGDDLLEPLVSAGDRFQKSLIAFESK